MFAQWQEDDEALTWHDFLLKYASREAIAYMREIEAAQAYAKENPVSFRKLNKLPTDEWTA